MSTKTGIADVELSAYVTRIGCRESVACTALRVETASMPEHNMQISPLQGAFLQMLAGIGQVRRYLEIGVFTGYSTLAVAEVLPEGGEIVALDISETYTRVALRHWEAAGLAHKIDLRVAPARETLEVLLADDSPFDLAFIDADKESLEHYFESALKLVRPGGVIAVDNVLWSGSVVDPDNQKPSTVAIRTFNAARHTDPRVALSLVPIGDGVTLLRVL